jgi:hypothetical protein
MSTDKTAEAKMTETTRRGFLAGLAGIFVLAQVPGSIHALPDGETIRSWKPYDVKAPDGWTYEWARSSLLGEPDPANITKRLEHGWTFVEPSAHPEVAAVAQMTAERAMEVGGLILMQKPTVEVEAVKRMQFELAQAMLPAHFSDYSPLDVDSDPDWADRQRQSFVETPKGDV